jgi:S1-C subfamily serine protease
MAKNSDNKKAREIGKYSVSSVSKRPGPSLDIKKPNLARLKNFNWRPAGLVAAFLLAAVIFGYAGAALQEHSSNSNIISGTVGNQKKVVTSTSQLISQIAKTVGPSVVSVNVSISDASADSGQGFGLFGFSQPENEQAAGTGIIISSDGIIMTNRHVVPEGTTTVSVTLSDGTELKNVTVLGRTTSSDNLDVAFLKVNDAKGHDLTPATIGDSSKVQVGDDVVAIGNALGQFQNTVTSGIISGYGRSVTAGDSSGNSSDTENLDNLFQTDAAINEGNSGGPLVNLNGQVIGINTAIAGNAQNIGFAIPINDIKGLMSQVLKSGNFSRPYLGVRYVPLTADIAKEYNLKVKQGAFIPPSSDPASPSVLAGGPADKAGLKESDVITAINGTSINENHSLTSLLSPHQPGDKVTLTVIRGGDTKKINVTLGALPTAANQ